MYNISNKIGLNILLLQNNLHKIIGSCIAVSTLRTFKKCIIYNRIFRTVSHSGRVKLVMTYGKL